MSAPRPRVGVDARCLLEPVGGLRRWGESVLPLLPEVAAQLEWLLFVTDVPSAMPAFDGVAWRRVPGSHRAVLRPWWEDVRLPRALAAEPVDALLSPTGVVPRTRLPVVAVVHDLVALTHPATLPWRHRRYWRRVARRLPQAARVVANSAATAADVCRLTGVPEARVTVAPLAPAAVFRPAAPDNVAAVERRLGLEPPYLLLVAGAGGRRKGLAIVGEALAGHDRVRLVVVGAGSVGSAAPPVRATGWLPDPDLAALMTGALAVACPSLTEGFGLPVVEAMACGAAVLASDAGALPEAAGGAAVLLPADDPTAWRAAVERLLADDELRARLGRAGRDRVRDLSWESTARIVADAVRAALAPA